ncbi:MAG: hypothetical protein A4E55_00975 [Pelotomaculum sp. PtaU1.Bin035]|nr:MAG: hypothetical protein A4E55_00975 [Pelotomaculum sp. PtaU1.Bin035]
MDYFPLIQVVQGVKVRWTIKVSRDVYNDCNKAIVLPAYHIEKKFEIGDNVVEFIPDKEGEFVYTCWMGMIKSKIKVVPNLVQKSAVEVEPALSKAQGGAVNTEPAAANTAGRVAAPEINEANNAEQQQSPGKTGSDNDVAKQENDHIQSLSGWIEGKLLPGNRAEQAGEKTQMWAGWIFDRDCIGINPVKHTKACNLMSTCYSSGLGIIPYVPGKSNDTYTAMNDFLVFDGASKTVAKTFLQNLPDDWKNNITIKVKGYPAGKIPVNADETNVPEEDASKIDHYLAGIHITSIEAAYIDGVSTNRLP